MMHLETFGDTFAGGTHGCASVSHARDESRRQRTAALQSIESMKLQLSPGPKRDANAALTVNNNEVTG